MTLKETVRGHTAPTSTRMVQDPSKVRWAQDVIPWKVTGLNIEPFPQLYPFNPSIHFDGTTWRMSVRCADYAMPGGAQIRSPLASTTHSISKNAMLILDPNTWDPVKGFEMREIDATPRAQPCTHYGFEDIRLFSVLDRGTRTPERLNAGSEVEPKPHLLGIAASLQLGGPGAPKHPEQVILVLDDAYNIVETHPIRGPWNGSPQKNWVPFDGTEFPRFLYSIERGVVFDALGPVSGDMELAPSTGVGDQPKPGSHGGTEVKVRRKAIALSTGRTGGRVEYSGLRGGSQLINIGVRVDELTPGVPPRTVGGEEWLGIAHEMRFINGKKFYWHVFYVADGDGKILRRTPAMKLAAEGIEFAAGMAIDADRLVVSFGVDDAMSRIGETSLEAVLGAMKRDDELDVRSQGAFSIGAPDVGHPRFAPAPAATPAPGTRVGAVRETIASGGYVSSVVLVDPNRPDRQNLLAAQRALGARGPTPVPVKGAAPGPAEGTAEGAIGLSDREVDRLNMRDLRRAYRALRDQMAAMLATTNEETTKS